MNTHLSNIINIKDNREWLYFHVPIPYHFPAIISHSFHSHSNFLRITLNVTQESKCGKRESIGYDRLGLMLALSLLQTRRLVPEIGDYSRQCGQGFFLSSYMCLYIRISMSSFL